MSPNSPQRLDFCWALGLWATLAFGCGYRSVFPRTDERAFAVQIGQNLIPEPLVAETAAHAARAELAAAGALAEGSTYPRLVVDVLRVDELSRGVYKQGDQPRAGGMSIAVVVRGRIFEAQGQEPSADSGDVRRAAQLAGDAEPRADSTARDDALREAAERAGIAVAKIALGRPEPEDEAP